jgi:hypothetical protein
MSAVPPFLGCKPKSLEYSISVAIDPDVWTGCVSQERLCVEAEVADMYPASHDDSSVNGFLPTAIRGELSCCRASLLTSHPAGS